MMALRFDANGENVNLGSDTSLDNLDPLTIYLWIRNAGTAGRLFTAFPVDHNLELAANSSLFYERPRATTNLAYQSSNNVYSGSGWEFLAMVKDINEAAGDLVRFFTGDLTTIVTETTNQTENDGSGAESDEANRDKQIGVGNAYVRGDVAIYGIINRRVSLGELRSLQFRPRVVPNTVFFGHLGFDGLNSVPDWSGTGNNGTVDAGAVVVAHVPLPPPFGFDYGWQGFTTAPPPAGWGPLLGQHRNRLIVKQ